MENIQEELDMIDVYLVEIMRLFPKSTEEKLMSRYDILGMAQKILTTIYNDSAEQDNNHKLVKLMVEEGKETLVFVNFEHKVERIFGEGPWMDETGAGRSDGKPPQPLQY